MVDVSPLINNFNGGELSPRLDARSDINKYFSGCRTLEGMIPFVEGGGTRVPGTYYVAEAKHSDKETRVIGFHFSTIQAYIIEIGDLYFRFYKDSGQIVVAYSAWTDGVATYDLGDLVTDSGSYYRCIVAHTSNASFAADLAAGKWETTDGASDLAYEIPHTFAEADVFTLKFAQSADTLWIVHPTYQPIKLTRSAHTTWTNTTYAPTANPFNGADKYPGAVGFFEERLMFAGTNNKPHTFWGSVSGDYDDLTIAAGNDAAFEYAIAAGRMDRIHWIQGLDALLMGGVGGPWRVSSSSGAGAITPTNISVKKQGSIGVKNLAPEVVGDTLLWVSRSGTSVRKSGYDYTSDRWASSDLMRVSKHIAFGSSATLSGIVDMDYQAEPVPILWCVRADGQILGMTFEAEEEVFAWFRQPTTGSFKSVAVIGEENAEDQVWVVAERSVNSSTVKYIEYFVPQNFYSVLADCFFVHAGLTFDGGDAENITGISNADPAVVTVGTWLTDVDGTNLGNGDEVRIIDCVGMTEVNLGRTKAYTVANVNVGAKTFELSGITSVGWGTWTSGGTAQKVTKTPSGIEHLEGEEVVALLDGAVQTPNPTVGSGTVTLSSYANKIHLGLGYSSIVEPMKPFISGEGGTTRGKKQKISGLVVSFFETVGAKAGPDQDNLKVIPFGVGTQPVLFTGDKDFEMADDWGTEPTISIVQDQPLPMTILAIVPELSIES